MIYHLIRSYAGEVNGWHSSLLFERFQAEIFVIVTEVIA